MSIRPLYDRVVVRPGSDKTTASGIVVAGSKRETRGQVTAVGAGHILQDGSQKPLTVKIGDIVEFEPNTGIPVVVDGEEFLVFQEASIIGIIDAE